MIITGVSATNLLRYEKLELRNLPGSGLIGITGPNESGKSSIGETLCFALFGRSFSLDTGDICKIIRWGESRCSVKVDFQTGDGTAYQIARFLDSDGNHGVRLGRAETPDEPIARGEEAVANALFELIGYDYEEFVESFYLAQREITTPHPHSHAIKSMAGLNTLEYVASEFKEDIEEDTAAIAAAEQEMEEVEEQLAELAIEDGYLARLDARRERLEQLETDQAAQTDALEAASQACQDNIPQMQAARRRRGSARFFTVVFLLLALLVGGAWAVMTQMPESGGTVALSDWLGRMVPGGGAGYLPWVLYTAAGLAALFVLAGVRLVMAGSRARALQKAAGELADQLTGVPETLSSRQSAMEKAALTPEPAETDADVESEDKDTSAPIPDTDQLATRIRHYLNSVEETRTEVSEVVARQRDLLKDIRQAAVGLHVAISREQARVERADSLNQVLDSYRGKLELLQRRVVLRELADDLIMGATRQISRRFNRDLRESVGRTLPLFTENRYEHLQIDDNLDVRVFSSEKRDFMDLDEISSGTQRQIMLAVRLCLAQELINRTVHGQQFVFLDEPFAFFDQERTRNAMTTLPQLSEELTQVWIIGQEFPPDTHVDRYVACSRDETSITSD